MTLHADLSGQRALITGASRGFGAHFARVLAGGGATVVLAALVELDVLNRASVTDAVAAAVPLDILVNNAGVTGTEPPLDQTEEDWDGILGTNASWADSRMLRGHCCF